MNKLQVVAERVLKTLGTFNLQMCSYYQLPKGNNDCTEESIATINVCKTSFCIAGYLAHEDKYPDQFFYKNAFRKNTFNYDAYSKELLGDRAHVWDFFFSSNWPDNVELAKERMEFVVKEGRIPTNFTGLLHWNYDADDIEWE